MAWRPAKIVTRVGKERSVLPTGDTAIPERALLPDEGWAGRQRGASQVINLCQSPTTEITMKLDLRRFGMSSTRLKGFALLAGVAMSLALAPAARALQMVTTAFSEPMNLQATVSAFNCENSPGPSINFEGAVTLGGMNVQMIF